MFYYYYYYYYYKYKYFIIIIIIIIIINCKSLVLLNNAGLQTTLQGVVLWKM